LPVLAVGLSIGCGSGSREASTSITGYTPTDSQTGATQGETTESGETGDATESETDGTGETQTESSATDSTDSTDPTDPTDATDTLTTGEPTTGQPTTGEPTTGPTTGPEPKQCGYTSLTYGQGMQELDVPKGSPETLAFTVPGLPDPAVVLSATLHFDSHDADHPGEEGVIAVNGNGVYDLPADAGWDNQDGTGTVDITGDTIAGTNVIRFGAGSLDTGSYYFIGNVQIEVLAEVDDCPEPPPPAAIERTVWYQDAEYKKRHNWVVRCNDYAFSAHGDEHIESDCDGLYAPDGTRKGKAIFAFPELVPATYEVQIRSRHTENRNPLGALFVVDGHFNFIYNGYYVIYTTDIWGTKAMGGDVEVVLDSSMESESDSVIWVKLVPSG